MEEFLKQLDTIKFNYWELGIITERECVLQIASLSTQYANKLLKTDKNGKIL